MLDKLRKVKKPEFETMKFHRSHSWKVSCCFMLMVWSGAQLHADDQTDVLSDAKVLDSLEVDLGDRSIFYNRVEPIVLKPWVKEEEPAAQEAVIYVPTAEDLAEEKRLAALRYEWINIQAAVYVGKGSEVRIQTEDGEIVALSSIDFRLFDSLLHFEQAGVFYSLFCIVQSFSKQELDEWKREDSTATWPVDYQVFPPEQDGKSTFQVLKAPSDATVGPALEAITAMHVYHDANRKALAEAFSAREEMRLASESQQASDLANPAPAKDTVINYFMVE